jgi:dTDP-4-amino-4,6-dideoxygalactose transaminase
MAVRKHAAKAVIVVHALGHPADMDALRNACPNGVHMIEDASGAIGATYKDRPVGSLADAAIFSFNGNKVVTAGGGGMIVTDDEKIARRSRHWSTQARVGQEYEHDEAGFNYRMTNINAAVGLAQMERLEEMVSSRRRIAKTYDEALSDRPDLRPMPREPWAHSNCWLYSVRTASRAVARNLVGHLQNQNIEARSFWCSLSRQAPYRNCPVENINNSNMLDGTVVSLPCSSSLQNHEQARVLEAVAGWRGDSLDR